MKSLIRVILVLAVLVLAGFAALKFWLGPKVVNKPAWNWPTCRKPWLFRSFSALIRWK